MGPRQMKIFFERVDDEFILNASVENSYVKS